MRRLPPLVPHELQRQAPYYKQESPSRRVQRSLRLFIIGSVLWAVATIFAISYYTGPGETTGARSGFSMEKSKEDFLNEDDFPSLNVSTVKGFFKQDEEETDWRTFDYIKENFGLLPFKGQRPSTPQWQRFQFEIFKRNRDAPENVVYKVLFLGRHGEGYHNVAEAMYGTKEWDCYWSMLIGNGKLVWEDAELTPLGVNQSLAANEAWKTQIRYGLEVPSTFYSSPLMRAATTLNYTFNDIYPRGTRPIVKELLRETIGIHTCDRRSPQAVLSERLPHFTFEGTFTSTDQLWNAFFRESNDQRRQRVRKVLHDIIRNDKNTFISITAHSGTIEAALEVLGHRKFGLVTGAMIPVLVKVEFLTKLVPSPDVGTSLVPPKCTGNDRVPAPTPTTIITSTIPATTLASSSATTSSSSADAHLKRPTLPKFRTTESAGPSLVPVTTVSASASTITIPASASAAIASSPTSATSFTAVAETTSSPAAATNEARTTAT